VFTGVRDVRTAATPRHGHLRERLITIVVTTLIVDAIGSSLMLLFEHNASRTAITNIGDSVFWTTAQLLTVSSQMPNPVTTGGRIVDVFLMAYAITIVATLAGSFGSFFQRHEHIEALAKEGR
jgi:hypothetical protein